MKGDKPFSLLQMKSYTAHKNYIEIQWSQIQLDIDSKSAPAPKAVRTGFQKILKDSRKKSWVTFYTGI